MKKFFRMVKECFVLPDDYQDAVSSWGRRIVISFNGWSSWVDDISWYEKLLPCAWIPRFAPLVCRLFGHKLTDCGYAGPESGCIDICCVRCGFSYERHWLY